MTHNIEGYRRNKFYLSQLIAKYEFRLLFLQEHWLTQEEATTIVSKDFVNYRFHSSSSDSFVEIEEMLLHSGPTWHGSLIGWQVNEDSNVTRLPLVSERFCGIKYKTNGVTILAYSVYFPTSGKDEEFLEVTSILAENIEQNQEKNVILIIGTDSNVPKNATRRRKDALNQLIEDFKLSPVSDNEKPTFHHNNGTSESKIDQIYIYIPSKCSVKIELNCQPCTKETPNNLSSHDPIISTVFLPKVPILPSKISTDYTNTYTDITASRPKWTEEGKPGYQEMSSGALHDLLTQFPEPEHIPILAELIPKILVKTAAENFEIPKKKKKIHKGPFFSIERRQAHQRNHNANVQWRKKGRPRDKDDPIVIERLVPEQYSRN